MHIRTTNQVTVSCKPAPSAHPISPVGFLTMPTHRTLATCASFGPSEAHDVGLLTFLGEIRHIFAILPQGHPLIVVPTALFLPDPMWVADIERSHLVLTTKVNHLAGGFMALITNTTLCSCAHLSFGALQFPPPS